MELEQQSRISMTFSAKIPFNLKILNGRSRGDPLGTFTYNDENLGSSTIDYSITSQNLYKHINNFMVLPQNELSDHCKIVTEFNHKVPTVITSSDNYDWKTLKSNYPVVKTSLTILTKELRQV